MPYANKSANAEYMKSYYQRNKERQLSIQKERYKLKKDEILAKSKARIKANPEKYREYFKTQRIKWETKHPGYHNNLNRRRYAEVKTLLFNAYGNKCFCCGESEPGFLTLDHILRDGKSERIRYGNRMYAKIAKEGFPRDRYRLACMNCNWGMRLGNACPHQDKGGLSLVSEC